MVQTVGVGTRVAVLQSAERGDTLAQADADQKASETLRFVECPECKRTSAEGPAIYRKSLLESLLSVGLALALCLGTGFVMGVAHDSKVTELFVAICLGIAAVTWLSVWFWTPAPWRHAKERVRFLPRVKRAD